ncbi:cholesterol side-chain cleavage enzyme, mitochondrial [Microcaecilia unicolor]|uniref:Cholesterol side-chain cleavage enzyme, mitochondrial n=1 Tax=Microcaecilia unicolor TaxID=1415580 RepID=A0A6P7WY86_9AMPH|nr:cholesterol side-chain cleavage enzyme, mitochondrial [Microcaecilia unicolor]
MLAKKGFRLSAMAGTCSLRILVQDDRLSFPFRTSHSIASELYTPSPQAKLVKSFDEIPGNWKNRWLNLYHFWRRDGFHNIHNLMVENYQKYGPIYRENIGYYESINIIQPVDAAALFKVEGMFPERLLVQPWLAYREYRKKKKGVLLKSGEDWRHDRLLLNREVLALSVMDRFLPFLNDVGEDFVKRIYSQIEKSGRGKWTADLSNDLFRFALESICNVLYGERLGLLQDNVDPEAQKFIDAVTTMFQSTAIMMYISPWFLRMINAKVWRDHIESWDVIFTQADKCIQNIYRDLRLNRRATTEYTGILSSLLLQTKLPLEDLKASVTELMAGGVDTTSITLLWTMYELARYPEVQNKLRAEIIASKEANQGDLAKMLKSVPLVKAAVKESLRLHPVAVSIQRRTRQDTVIQNYFIPSGSLVQIGLYAMGRDPSIFAKPEKYNPERWLDKENNHFKNLGFGFGPRQCLGRRIAEMEMQLFLIHILQHFKIEVSRLVDVKTTFDLILVPDRPINLTLRPLN